MKNRPHFKRIIIKRGFIRKIIILQLNEQNDILENNTITIGYHQFIN